MTSFSPKRRTQELVVVVFVHCRSLTSGISILPTCQGSITDCDVTLVDSTLIIGKQIDIDRVRATILHQWKDIITRSGLTYELG